MSMTRLNHVTYHVPAGTLEHPYLTDLMNMLGLHEIDPKDPFEHGWEVRWWTDDKWDPSRGMNVHLVEGHNQDKPVLSSDLDQDLLDLGHFCVKLNDQERYDKLRGSSRFLQRDSGSGRIWVGFSNLRIEVRP
jgi:hypothetical protein